MPINQQPRTTMCAVKGKIDPGASQGARRATESRLRSIEGPAQRQPLAFAFAAIVEWPVVPAAFDEQQQQAIHRRHSTVCAGHLCLIALRVASEGMRWRAMK